MSSSSSTDFQKLKSAASGKLLDFFTLQHSEEEEICDMNDNYDKIIVAEIKGPNIWATVTYEKNDSYLNGYIYKLGMENTCFSGTSGELAYRLITTIISKDIVVPKDCSKIKMFEFVQEQALLLFKGTFFAPWLLSYKCKTIRKNSFENLQRYNSHTKSLKSKNNVWLSTDASIVGIGKCPDPKSSDEEYIVIPISEYPNAPIILHSLVYLTSYDGGYISYSTCSDLRFGAFDPTVTNEIAEKLSNIDSILKGFPAYSPAEFLNNLFMDDRNVSVDPRVLDYVIFEYVIDGYDDIMIQWGPSGSIDFSNKTILSLVKFDTFHAYILFGPPLHILEPFPQLFDVKLHEVIRFSSGNLLQMPITMHNKGTSDDLLEQYFPSLHQKIINASKANAMPKYPKKTYYKK